MAMVTATTAYKNANPGPKWTTDRILKLAKQLQREGKDLIRLQYGLSRLAVGRGQTEEVSDLIAALIEHDAENKGKEVKIVTDPELLLE